MTLRAQQLIIFDPVEWDRQLLHSWQVTLDHLNPHDPAYTSLVVLALIAGQAQDRMAVAMTALTENVLARGAHLLGLVDLGRYTEVMLHDQNLFPDNNSSISLFDAANANFAVAISAGALHRHDEALRYMHTAQALYSAIKMTRRTQLIHLEIERIRLATGTASPEKIISTMAEAELSERRKTFSQHLLAEAYMIYGEYSTAEMIAPPDSGLNAFASVLSGVEARVIPEGDYGALARALSDADAEIPTLPHAPERGYAHLLKVLRLIKVGQSGLPQAFQLLVSFEPKSADHQVWWGLMLMAIAPGVPAARRYLDQALTLAQQGRDGLTTQRGMIDFLSAHAPFLLVLYATLPNSPAEVVDAAVSLPLWTGNAVFWRGKQLPLRGGETGSCLLADDLRGVRSPARHPQEQTRFEKSRLKNLEITGPTTAVSWVLKVLLLTAAYTHLNSAYWRDKAGQFLPLLCGEEVQEAAQEVMSQDCASLGLGSKIVL